MRRCVNILWKTGKAAGGKGLTCTRGLALSKVLQYSKTNNTRQSVNPELESDSSERRREKRKPSECSVLLFPGQGSQFVGMGKGLAKYGNVKQMFNVAEKILGYDLLSLCLNGPEEELSKTVHCQPAVFVTSLAAVERLNHEAPETIEKCVAAAGFSVGEFAALVFAGALDFAEGSIA